MKTNYTMELQRHDVTPAAFLAYVRSQAKKRGISIDIDTKYFVSGEKVNGQYWDTSYDGGTPSTRPAIAERVKCLPYEQQTYIMNFDGSVFNEIIDFTFDDGKTGTGYYYIISTDAEPGDAEKATAYIVRHHERAIKRNAAAIEKKAAEIADAENDVAHGWRDADYTAGYIASLRAEIDAMTRENAEHTAAVAEMTEASTTEASTTEASTTEASTTEASTTEASTTEASTTEKHKKGYDVKKLFDIVDGAITADRAAFHEPRDNSKLKGIPAFNLAPGRTCSAAACAHCLRDGCYAVKNACCHGYDINSNNCLRAWTENTAYAMNHMQELEKALNAWLTKKRPQLFRIHSAGDFFSIEYANMWRRVAAQHPETRFLAFTKQFDIIRAVDFCSLQNFELVLSGWTGVYVPEDLRKYYRVAWCNDGQETRIPADAIHCPGDCNKCRACWFLSRIGKDSYFDKH